MIRVVEVVGFTVLFWLFGAYIELDWVWIAHVGHPENRAALLFFYLFGLVMFVTCPFWPRGME